MCMCVLFVYVKYYITISKFLLQEKGKWDLRRSGKQTKTQTLEDGLK